MLGLTRAGAVGTLTIALLMTACSNGATPSETSGTRPPRSPSPALSPTTPTGPPRLLLGSDQSGSVKWKLVTPDGAERDFESRPDGCYEPSMSPDGTWLVSSCTDGIYTATSASLKFARLIKTSDNPTSFAFSPDSRTLCFETSAGNQRILWIAGRAGNTRKIAQATAKPGIPDVALTGNEPYGDVVACNATTIYLTPVGDTGEAQSLSLLSIALGKIVRKHDLDGPSGLRFSDDLAKVVVFGSGRDGRELIVMDVASGAKKSIYRVTEQGSIPPDEVGSVIATAEVHGDTIYFGEYIRPANIEHLLRIPLSGGKAEALFSDPSHPSYGIWSISRDGRYAVVFDDAFGSHDPNLPGERNKIAILDIMSNSARIVLDTTETVSVGGWLAPE